MSAKRLSVIVICLLVGLVIAGVTCRHWLQVRYHVHALRRASSEVASAQKEKDCVQHIRALVALGYLHQGQMVMEHCAVTGAVQQAFANSMNERMAPKTVYKYWISTDGTAITYYCEDAELNRFRSVIYDFDRR